jgi:hypothetical protein
MRYVLPLVLLLVLPAPAEAGRRCNRTYQTLRSSYGWSASHGCYACHQPHGQKQGVSQILGGLAAKQSEYAALLTGLERLGFRQTSANYVTSGQYAESYGQAGQSVYASVPHIDVMALGQMSSRLASQAQEFAGQATLGAQDLVAQAQRVAEIQATGQAAAAALRAASGTPQPSFRQFSFTTKIDQSGNVTVEPQQPGVAALGSPDDVLAQVDAVVQARCAKCHNANDHKGELDLTALRSWAPAQQAETLWECYRRVTASDPKERMPQQAEPIPADESAAFALAAVRLRQERQGGQ